MPLTRIPLNTLQPLPRVDWLDGNLSAWQQIHRQLGTLRPPVVNVQTGHVLSDMTAIHALQAAQFAGEPAPSGIDAAGGAWLLEVQTVDVAEADEPLYALILAGGIDRVLLGKFRDSSTVDAVLGIAEGGFDRVPLLGISLDELDELLGILAAGDDAPRPAVPLDQPDSWGIPTLDLSHQGTIYRPALKWGTVARRSAFDGLYHFYTADRKFRGLLRNPELLTESGCRSVIEINFSTSATMPRALALYRIFQKRTLSRRWQSAGIGIWVDLNVDRALFDLALLGVPSGWQTYANRAYTADLTHLADAYTLAQARAGGRPVTYLVYGGGKKARDVCERSGWHWLPEHNDQARGRELT